MKHDGTENEIRIFRGGRYMCSDNDKIADIQRVARMLNCNQLSLEEYLKNGGKYSREIIDDCDSGGFANICELAGVKTK